MTVGSSSVQPDGTLHCLAGISSHELDAAEQHKIVWNNTAGGFSLTFEANAGSPTLSTVTVPNGAWAHLAVNSLGHVFDTLDTLGSLSVGTLTVTDAFGFASGTVGAPGIFFNGDTNTGIFRPAADTIAFSTGGVEFMRADSGQTVLVATDMTVGSSSVQPDGTLHVHTASAGTVTANATADIAVFEAGSSDGISILTPDGSSSLLVFGVPSDNDFAVINAVYNAGNSYIRVDNGIGTERFRFTLDSTPALGIGGDPGTTTYLLTPAAVTAASSLRLPHGTAPTSPVNGDMWTTTAGLFVRVNGTTVGPLT